MPFVKPLPAAGLYIARTVHPARRQPRLFAAWLMLAAALALAVMPTLSRALAHAVDAPALLDICSAHGAPLPGAAEDTPADAPSLAGQVLDHCAYCGLSADRHAPLPVAAPAVAAPLPAVSMPAGFWQAPQPAFAWRGAQPRAPPLS